MGAGSAGSAAGDRAAPRTASRRRDPRSRRRRSAAPGSTTATRARPATCRAICTRSRSRSGATGRGCARRATRSSATCASVAREYGVERLVARTPRSRAARGTTTRALDGHEPRTAARATADALIVATGPAAPHAPFRALPGRTLRGPQLPLRRVGPRLRPARQARRGDRHGRERRPVRPRDRRAGAERLVVFQRTGNWFLPRKNRAVPARLSSTLIRHVPRRPGLPPPLRLQLRRVADADDPPPADARAGSATRARRCSCAGRSATASCAASVWPDYTFGCKRVLFSSHFLPALQRPNVELVTDPISASRRPAS